MTVLNPLEESSSVLRLKQTRLLLYLMYIQAIFLGLTYVVGVWLATTVNDISVTQPEVIVHGIVSCSFASLTAAVGFLGALHRRKDISIWNLALFAITVIAGVTGFAFLGDTSNTFQKTITNLSMIATVGIGMPVTGYSLSKVSSIVRSNGRDEKNTSPTSAMSYLALGALSLTIIAGVATRTISLYAFAVVAHFSLAALTVSLVLGVLVLSVLEGSSDDSSSSQLVQQRVGFSLLSLAAISIAGGVGVVTIFSAGVSYVVVMAEVAVLVYAFLILAIAAPFNLNVQVWRRHSPK